MEKEIQKKYEDLELIKFNYETKLAMLSSEIERWNKKYEGYKNELSTL